MIQFITNHPYLSCVILYGIIGFILGLNYYLNETFKEVWKPYKYTKHKLLTKYLGISICYIILWGLFIITDTNDLYKGINRRYSK